MPSRSEIWKCAAEFYREQLKLRVDSIRLSGLTIEQKWGLTADTLHRYFVGFAPAEKPLFDILRNELRITTDDVIANNGWGILRVSKTDHRKVYNYFQDRIVFAYPRGSQIEFLSGRKTDSESDFYDSKYLHTFLEGQNDGKPLYLEPASKGPTIVVEGHAQALRMRQEGFAGIAIGGANPPEHQIAILKRVEDLYWWPDVDQLAPSSADYVQKSDGSTEYRPPVTRYDRMRRILPTCLEMRANLVTYDADFCMQHDKGDQNDWWMRPQASKDEFLRHLANAIDPYKLLVFSIDPDLPITQRAPLIDETLDAMVKIPDIVCEDIWANLKRHLDLSQQTIKTLQRKLWHKRKDGSDAKGKAPRAEDFTKIVNYSEIKPGMDFVNDTLFYTIHKPIQTKDPLNPVEFRPYMVTSTGTIFELNAEQLNDRKLYMDPDTETESDAKRWSLDPNVPYSLPEYLQKRHAGAPDSNELFAEIRAFFEEYLYVENPYILDCLAIFTACTYTVQIYGAMGLLNLTGTRSVGKSRVLELIEAIAWDPVATSQSTESWLFRNTDGRSPTVLIDEAEFLALQFFKGGQTNDKASMLNAAYRKNARVGRSVGDSHKSKNFRTYTCYVIASTREVNPTLASRSITVPMVKRPSDRQYPHFFPERVAAQAASIRNRLHYWALCSAADIYESYKTILSGAYDTIVSKHHLRDRELEIWSPALAIAQTLDYQMTGKRWIPADDNSRPDRGWFSTILTSALLLTEVKSQQLSEQDLPPKLIIAIRQMLKYGYVQPQSPTDGVVLPPMPEDYEYHEELGSGGWYSTQDLTKYCWRLQGLGEIKWPKQSGPKSMKPQLATVGICKYPLEEKRWTVGANRKQFVRILPQRVIERCNTYGILPDAEIDFLPDESMPQNKNTSPPNDSPEDF